ncbi:MAG: peptide deformylase [Eggerthellaceae bacterium]|nr:peptide deformylase [Eggerthellaceae bacterium]MBR3257457.1 peptide deformylase [Eggerthellaceae bacterium]
MKIVISPDPVLNQVAEPCTPGDKKLVRLAKEMAKAMYAAGGVGLAAPQLGVSKRIIVVDCETDTYGKDPIVLVNPVIEEAWGDPVTAGEGCLSCPGVNIPITRHPWVRVSYFDLDGEEWEIESDGLLGRCLQHEIDHLNGVTLFESVAPELKLKALAAYDKALAAGSRPGDVDFDI